MARKYVTDWCEATVNVSDRYIADKVLEYFANVQAFSGESVAQSDRAAVEGIEMLAELADEVFIVKYRDGESGDDSEGETERWVCDFCEGTGVDEDSVDGYGHDTDECDNCMGNGWVSYPGVTKRRWEERNDDHV